MASKEAAGAGDEGGGQGLGWSIEELNRNGD
jgi:hypothetical protein